MLKRAEINRHVKKQASESNIELEREQPILHLFNKGFSLKDDEEALPFFMVDYLELIDWTGRAIRAAK